jgi:hypothetical protein
MADIKTMKSQIWKLLKTGRVISLEEFYLTIPHADKKQLGQFLDSQVKQGFLRRTAVGYQLKIVLSPPIVPKEHIGTYKYERIAGATPIPKNYMNPDIHYLCRKDQGERGTCVGQSTAYGRELDYMKLTGTKPEIRVTKRNIPTSLGPCYLVHDEGYQGFTFSAQCAYVWSRELGHVDAPEGSYVDLAVQTLKSKGCCFEEDWYTPKTHACAPDWAFPTLKPEDKAATHVIDGYSTTTDFDTICRAIYEKGYVYMPINIYENYNQNGGQGIFPDPRGECVGGHALCWVGYDLEKQELYCVHSWMDGWSLTGGITKKYWMYSGDAAFIIIDASEAKEAQKVYKKIHLQSNVRCTFTMGTDTYTGTDWYLMLELGKSYFVNAKVTPAQFYKVDEIDATFVVSESDGNLVTFTFERMNFGEKIRAIIAELLKKLKNRG